MNNTPPKDSRKSYWCALGQHKQCSRDKRRVATCPCECHQ